MLHIRRLLPALSIQSGKHPNRLKCCQAGTYTNKAGICFYTLPTILLVGSGLTRATP